METLGFGKTFRYKFSGEFSAVRIYRHKSVYGVPASDEADEKRKKADDEADDEADKESKTAHKE